MQNASQLDRELTRADFAKGIRASATLIREDSTTAEFANMAAMTLAAGATRSGFLDYDALLADGDFAAFKEKLLRAPEDYTVLASWIEHVADVIEDGGGKDIIPETTAPLSRQDVADAFFKLAKIGANDESFDALRQLRPAAIDEGFLDRGIAVAIEQDLMAVHPTITSDTFREMAERYGHAVLLNERSDKPINAVIAQEIRNLVEAGRRSNAFAGDMADAVGPLLDEAYNHGLPKFYDVNVIGDYADDRDGFFAWVSHVVDVIEDNTKARSYALVA